MYNTSQADPLAAPHRIRLRGSKLDPMDMKVFEPTRQLLGNGSRLERLPTIILNK